MAKKFKAATCHPDRPSRTKGLCKQCDSAARYQANKERHAAQGKAWRENNRDRTNELSRAAYARDPQSRRAAVAKCRAKNPGRGAAESRAYRERNRDKLNEASRNVSPEKKAARNEYARQWRLRHRDARNEAARVRRAADKDYNKRHNLKYEHGLTLEDYDAMLAKQSGVCAICAKPCTVKSRLSVDHCHKTGKIRALLCNPCNQGIGLFADDGDRLRSAGEYVDRHREVA